MMRSIQIVTLLGLLAVCALGVQADTSIITASGQSAIMGEPSSAKAYMMAKQDALTDAISNLLQDACASVDSNMSEKDLSRRFDAIVSSMKVVSERMGKDKGGSYVEVTVEATAPAPAISRPVSAGPYTSVIIDTTALNVKRSMAPKIFRQNNSEVWGTVKVDIEYVEDHGIVGYARDLDEATACPRAGNNPLVIKALSRGDCPYGGTAVISDEDADLILAENKKTGFLDKFNVIFIIDPSSF